jgi:PilZ domain-containing protein
MPDRKEPFLVYLLAMVFLLAPVANILVSFARSGMADWYHPAEFVALLRTIPAADWIWLAGTFVSGAALLLRHKSAWLLGVASLVVVLLFNTYRALQLDFSQNVDLIRAQIVFAVFVALSLLIIGLYARYPYLDRRQGWMFPTADRYQIRTPVVVHAALDLTGHTESISTSGLFVRLAAPTDAVRERTTVTLSLTELPRLKEIETEVVQADRDVLRLRFRGLRWGARGLLEGWLRSKA